MSRAPFQVLVYPYRKNDKATFEYALFKRADEGEQFVQSHYLYELSPFYILPLKHWRFHNEAEIRWLEFFKEMVENIEDFKEQYDKIVEQAIKKS